MGAGALFGLCTAFGEHLVWETRMGIFSGENITCTICRFRHPRSMPCTEAKRRACAAAFERVDRAQTEAYRLGITTEELAKLSRREDAKFVPLPDGAGKLNCATVFNDKLFIGCEHGMWVRSNEGTWERISV